ncbi:MAG: hypothetical protein K6A94_13980 [Bacteroidales bacterium]|nr:hypothetical protein [Bacteroidales bacterium]
MRKVKLKQKRGNQLDGVSPADMQEALRLASFWLTDKLEGRTDGGPFSEAALGEPARLYFPKRAYMALKTGDWEWKKGVKLSTMLIRIMKSDMHHTITDWYAKGEPEVVAISSLAEGKKARGDEDGDLTDEDIIGRYGDFQSRMITDMELAEELVMQEETRKLGYEIATAAANGDEKLLLYVQLVKELNNYRAIALKMRITMQKVKDMEAELLRKIRAK